MFDYSRMEGQYFEPDEKICIILDNTNYERLRELPEYSKRWEDDPLTATDAPEASGFVYGDLP